MRQVPGEKGLYACHCPRGFNWLKIFGACSKDAVADVMAVSDASVPQVNVCILFKAKAGDVEDVKSPKKKTPAPGPLP